MKVSARASIPAPIGFTDLHHVVQGGLSFKANYLDTLQFIISNTFISDTYVNIDTLAISGLLIPGALYEITDPAGGPIGLTGSQYEHTFKIILRAITPNTFALEGIMSAIFINKAGAPIENDKIGYKFVSGDNNITNILWRIDQRENYVSNKDGFADIRKFQWGNDDVIGNMVEDSCCITLDDGTTENAGSCQGNVLTGAGSRILNAASQLAGGSISQNFIHRSFINAINNQGIIENNRVENDARIEASDNTGTIRRNRVFDISRITVPTCSGTIELNELIESRINSSGCLGSIVRNRIYGGGRIDADDLQTSIDGNEMNSSRLSANTTGPAFSFDNNYFSPNGVSTYTADGANGTITRNKFLVVGDFTFIPVTGVMQGCVLDLDIGTPVLFPDGAYIDRILTYNYSTFECTVDVTGLTYIDLFSDSYRKICGLIILTGANPAENIDFIAGSLQGQQYEFKPPLVGVVPTWIGTPYSAASSGQIVLTTPTFVQNGANGDKFIINTTRLDGVFQALVANNNL